MASTLSPEPFEALLRRLDPDRDRAGVRYEQLRRRLVSLFTYRVCHHPEELADETLDRVGRKLLEMGEGFQGNDPCGFIFGVAWNIAKESFHHPQALPLRDDAEVVDPAPFAFDEDDRHRGEQCLERCLGELGQSDRELVLHYFQEEKRARIRHRSALAEELHITVNALRLRIHRLTQRLRECVFQCMETSAPRAVKLR